MQEVYTMAKTIKFNLICDGHPIRTLEDLRENFSIEDVLEYYGNGLLEKWLRVPSLISPFLMEMKFLQLLTHLLKAWG